MPQTNFPCHVAVDWLSLSCKSLHPINAQTFADGEAASSPFRWTLRSYSSKQFRAVYDVEAVVDGGVVLKFGVFSCDPTLESWQSTQCSLKLDNSLLYLDGGAGWEQLLHMFLDCYNIYVQHIIRCDIAADFLYLKNRVSGAKLAQKLKSCEWWKMGTVKVCEYYKLPYSVSAVEEAMQDVYNSEIYFQQNQFTPRVESMTFGTMASDVQVCLYDKTLELKRTEQTIEVDGQKITESGKEYIRDTWKQSGVYDSNRHTWRLEIRLKTPALFLSDTRDSQLRAMTISDIKKDRLRYTFFAAQERYFRIVDPTEGGTKPLDNQRLMALATHKSRLPRVDLFSYDSLDVSLGKRAGHVPCNQYNRAVINRVEFLAQKARVANEISGHESTVLQLKQALDAIESLAKQQSVVRSSLRPAVQALNNVLLEVYDGKRDVDRALIEPICKAKKILLAHLRTEAPVFSRNVKGEIENLMYKLSPSSRNELHSYFDGKKSITDAGVLREAAKILKSVYSVTLRQQQMEDSSLEGRFDAIFNENDYKFNVI